jgi:hypothetical protein
LRLDGPPISVHSRELARLSTNLITDH